MMIDTKETTEGRRIEARSFADGQVDAVRRYWYNDQWQVLTQGLWSQAYASFTLSRNYLYGNTIDEVLGFEWVVNGTPSIWYYYLHDHLYSPAAMLTDYGVVERYEYDAYGRRSVMTPGFAHRNNSHYLSDIGLTGREIDELDRDAAATPRLQHMHYRHRDYNPQLGRFMQHDPLEYIDGQNLYLYVKSKPTAAIDPFGLNTCDLACKRNFSGRRFAQRNALQACLTCCAGFGLSREKDESVIFMCNEIIGRCGARLDKAQQDALKEILKIKNEAEKLQKVEEFYNKHIKGKCEDDNQCPPQSPQPRPIPDPNVPGDPNTPPVRPRPPILIPLPLPLPPIIF